MPVDKKSKPDDEKMEAWTRKPADKPSVTAGSQAGKAQPGAPQGAPPPDIPYRAELSSPPRGPELGGSPPDGPQGAPPMPRGPRTYTVKAGDNLSRIAKALLGDANRWKDIFEANRNILKNPDVIRVGQELIIPEN